MRATARLSRSLIAMLALAMSAQVPLARADLVDTDAMAAKTSQVEQERAKVRDFLERANVKERLQALGVDGVVSADRVASLSEEEVHAMAGKIEGMPAGGNLSSTDIIIIMLIAILIAIAI
ncbi:PA2779 family protein [Zoogloea sp.]|uniref:PA2779 family protein n=1 Tax=Zoogloea sp. TaxID=49181 RepID=UPI0031FD038E